VYPTLESIQTAFPHVDPSIVRHDLAYPAMLVFLPSGLLGLVVASLAAAYMSTISTHLNWGASYMVDDVYRRFVAPTRDERHYVHIVRAATVVLIVLGSGLALWFENAMQAFQILLQIGAGTGLVFLLRWFWWRVNVWSELSAMVISFLVAIYFLGRITLEPVGIPLDVTWPIPAWDPSTRLVAGVLVTTVGWLTITLLTPPAQPETLRRFHALIRPLGPGWRGAGLSTEPGSESDSLAAAFLAWFLGCVTVYGAVFATGYGLYGRMAPALVCAAAAVAAAVGLLRVFPRVGLR
jgi:Na+/proline symporter